jgi:hypothetical protein
MISDYIQLGPRKMDLDNDTGWAFVFCLLIALQALPYVLIAIGFGCKVTIQIDVRKET